MTEVLESRRQFEQTRIEAREMVARSRALLGRSCRRARDAGKSRRRIGEEMGIGPQQVAEFEQAYQDWEAQHPGESLD